MKRILKLSAIIGFLLLCTLWVASRPQWKEIQMNGHTRRYLMAEPKDQVAATPVLFVFHGGGGTAVHAARMGFSKRARELGYLVVYPDGVDRHWNDGRTDHPKYDPTIDDLGFVKRILEDIEREYNVDSRRIYATGPSNGGMMSHMVGIRLSDRFCAVAPMIGGIPRNLDPPFNPEHPVSVLIIQGTEDPLVPYDGGPVTVGRKTHGQVESTDRALELWREHNKCDESGTTTAMPDPEPDGCSTTKTVWSGGTEGAEVILYRVEGGGHTVPGGFQYLPKSIIGVLSNDFDAVDEIFEFFGRHSKP